MSISLLRTFVTKICYFDDLASTDGKYELLSEEIVQNMTSEKPRILLKNHNSVEEFYVNFSSQNSKFRNDIS